MIKTTLWRPDTCGCEIAYDWDSESDQNTRVHTVSRIVKACPAHQGMSKDVHFPKVVEENQRKNKAHALILENMPELVTEITNDDGSKTKKLKAGIEFRFSFDETRKLKVELVGATAKHKSDIQTIANTQLGASKIDII